MEFHDHTHASNFEKFVAVLEQALRSWSKAGLDQIIAKGFQEQRHEQPAMVRVQASLQHRLPWRREPYLLQLYLPTHHLASAAAAGHQRSARTAAAHAAAAPFQTCPQTSHAGIASGGGPSSRASEGTEGAGGGGAGHEAPLAGAAAGGTSASSREGARAAGVCGSRGGGDGLETQQGATGSTREGAVGVRRADGDGGGGGYSWEVRVELDMAELQQDINAIMLEVGSEEQLQAEKGGAAPTMGTGSTPLQQPQQPQQPQMEPVQCPPAPVALRQQPLSSAVQPSASPSPAATPIPCWHEWWPQQAAPRAFWRYIRQHKLQRWFGLDHFLVLVPHSYSRRLLDEGEATTLLAALRCALDGAGLPWPVLLPVHDSLRDAYSGAAAIPRSSAALAPPLHFHPHPQLPAPACSTRSPLPLHLVGGSVQLAADSIHSSSPPAALSTLQGQLSVFAAQLAHTAPAAAAACRAANAALRLPHASSGCSPTAQASSSSGKTPCSPTSQWPPNNTPGNTHTVTLSACYTYVIPPPSTHITAAAAAAVSSFQGAAGVYAARCYEESGVEADNGRVHSNGDGGDAAICEHGAEAQKHGRGFGGWQEYERGGEGRPGHHQRSSSNGSSSSSGRGSSGSRRPLGSGGDGEEDAGPWDAGAPWQAWTQQLDPIASIEMDVAWQDLVLEQQPQQPPPPPPQQQQQGPIPGQRGGDHADAAAPAASAPDPFNVLLRPSLTQQWMVHVLKNGGLGKPAWGGFLGMGPRDRERQYCELHRGGSRVSSSGLRQGVLAEACAACGPASFSAQIAAMLLGRPAVALAPTCCELADDSWWLDEAIPLGVAPRASLSVGGGGGRVVGRLMRAVDWVAQYAPPSVPSEGMLHEMLQDIFDVGKHSGSPRGISASPCTSRADTPKRAGGGGWDDQWAQWGADEDETEGQACLSGGALGGMQAGKRLEEEWAGDEWGWELAPGSYYVNSARHLHPSANGPRRNTGQQHFGGRSRPSIDDGSQQQQQQLLPAFERTAPPHSLLARLALHCLLLSNPRAIAVLWLRFVRDVRFSYWEACKPLPRMDAAAYLFPTPPPPQPPPPQQQQQQQPLHPGPCLRIPWDSAVAAGLVGSSLQPRTPHATAADAMCSVLSWRGSGCGRAGQTGGCEAPAQQQPVLSSSTAGTLQGQPLEPGCPDLSTCLLHQKLQVLNACIIRRSHKDQVKAAEEAGASATAAGAAAEAAKAAGAAARTTALATTVTPEGPAARTFPAVKSRRPKLGARRAGAAAAAAAQAARASGSAYSGSEGSFHSAGEDEEVLVGGSSSGSGAGRWPQGYVGVLQPGLSLMRHPRRPVRVPLVQPPPLLSEDRRAEAAAQEAALRALVPAPQGGPTLACNAELCSDMAAFKAANPGAVLADFLVWRAPCLLHLADQQPSLAVSMPQDSAQVPSTAAGASAAAAPAPAGAAGTAQTAGAAGAAAGAAGTAGAAVTAVDKDSAQPGAGARTAEPQGVGPGAGAQRADRGVRGGGSMAARGGADGARHHRRHDGRGGAENRAQAQQQQQQQQQQQEGQQGHQQPQPQQHQEQQQQQAQQQQQQQQQLISAWATLWDSTAPCPAWEQKDLQDPVLEGERILHELETLSPADLQDQLLGVVLSCALQLLVSSAGARVPAVADVARKYHRGHQSLVSSAMRLCQSTSHSRTATASTFRPLCSPVLGRQLSGFEDSALELLTEELCFLEQAVILSESLVRRLPGCPSLCAAVMLHATVGRASEEDWGEEEGSGRAAAPAAEHGCAGGRAGGSSKGSQEYGDTQQQQHHHLHHQKQQQQQHQRLAHTPPAMPLAPKPAALAAAGPCPLLPAPLVLRVFQPVAQVTAPAARIALAAQVCQAAAWHISEAEARALFLGAQNMHPQAKKRGRDTSSAEGNPSLAHTAHLGVQQHQQQRSGDAQLGGEGRMLRVLQQVLEPHWPQAAHREWVLHVQQCSHPSLPHLHLLQQQQQQRQRQVPQPSAWCSGASLPSRMYVSQAQGEMRLATVLVQEQ